MSEILSGDSRRPDDRFFLAQSRFDATSEPMNSLELSIFCNQLNDNAGLAELKMPDLLREGMQRLLLERGALQHVAGSLIEHYSFAGDAARMEFVLSYLSRELLGVENGDLSSALIAQSEVEKFFGVAGALSWACSMAIHSGSLETVKLLHRHGLLTLGFENSACAAFIPVTDTDADAIEDAFHEILAGESDVDRTFSTYLHDAVVFGHFEIVEWLIAQPEVDRLQVDGYGRTAYELGMQKIESSELKLKELRAMQEKLSGAEREWCSEEIRLVFDAQENRRRCVELLKP